MAANKIPVNFDRGSMAAWPRYPYANEIPYTLGGPPFHGPPSCEAPRQPTIHTSSHLKVKWDAMLSCIMWQMPKHPSQMSRVSHRHKGPPNMQPFKKCLYFVFSINI